MKKFFAVVAASLILFVSIAGAEIKTYTGTGEYLMSDFEDIDVARERAKERAQENAREQAGVYLTSFSKSENARLTVDEISAVTNNITEIYDVNYSEDIRPLTEQSTAVIIVATLKAKVDTDGIAAFLKRDENDRAKIVEQNNDLKSAVKANDARVEDLKRRYNESTSQTERDKIKAEITSLDKRFLAIQKLYAAEKLYYRGDYRAALALCNESIDLRPDYVFAYNRRAAVHEAMKNFDAAIADSDKAIELEPTLSPLYNNRGTIRKKMKNFDAAIRDFDKAVALDPKNSAAYSNRGAVYADMKNFNAAVNDFNKAVELNPRDAAAYNNLGNAYMNLKNYDAAQTALNKSLELNPKNAAAYVNFGYLYSDKGDTQRALESYSKARSSIAAYSSLTSTNSTRRFSTSRKPFRSNPIWFPPITISVIFTTSKAMLEWLS